jgi:hypothetical protein
MPPPADAEDLRPAARRFKAGHWLAVATALLLIIGAVAKATGAPSWLIAVLWSAMAACAVLSATWMMPTYVRFKRLAKGIGKPGE